MYHFNQSAVFVVVSLVEAFRHDSYQFVMFLRQMSDFVRVGRFLVTGMMMMLMIMILHVVVVVVVVIVVVIVVVTTVTLSSCRH